MGYLTKIIVQAENKIGGTQALEDYLELPKSISYWVNKLKELNKLI